MTFKTRTWVLALSLAIPFAAHAAYIDPALLHTSPDGANKNVQQQIYDAGYTSNVGTSTSDYGDQVDADWFQQCCGPMTWSILFQAADYAPYHRVGYFTVSNPTTSDITWVIGGSYWSGLTGSNYLASSNTFSVNGLFGIALGSGDNKNNPFASTIYYSVPGLNADGKDHFATFNTRDGNGNLIGCDLIGAWEDLPNLGDMDYNDFGFRMQNTEAVPEPASLAALGLGALGLWRRKRKSA